VKSFLYAVVLLAVLLACVVFLRSCEDEQERFVREPRKTPAVTSAPPEESGTHLLESYDDSKAGELYAAGVELYSLWHVREATVLFERAVAADSSFYSAWVRLVECFAHPLVGREDDARNALARARATHVSDADTTFLTGLENLFIVRDYVAAAALLDRAVQTEVSHEDATYYDALALLLSGRVGEARQKTEDLIRRDETVGRFAELAIRCSAAAGDLGAAGEQAKELARVYAEEPYAYVLLGLVEQMMGHPQSAAEFCNNALILDSRYIPAILARANLYAASSEFEAARVSFEKLLMFDDPLLRSLGHEGIGFVDLLSGRFNAGIDELDEAIRAAMLAGAVRRGLSIATQLVGDLCGLGQADAARGVVDRWVTGFGDIPVALASLRINVLEGDLDTAARMLREIQASKEWARWAGMMSIDYPEVAALVHIGAEQYQAALNILAEGAGVGAFRQGSRLFLKGYASFDNGMAESAADAFAEVGQRLYGVEFPYHGDAVQYVRSLFYLGEASIARGNEAPAAAYYEKFLGYWGDADWDVQAIARARARLEALTASPSQ
jgi:tetratricopeptide (TPR) repeat protein